MESLRNISDEKDNDIGYREDGEGRDEEIDKDID